MSTTTTDTDQRPKLSVRERIEREMDINEATIGEPVIYRDDLPDLFDEPDD